MTDDRSSSVVSPGCRSSRQATPSIVKPKGKPRQWRFNYSDRGQEGSLPEERLTLATGAYFKRV